jgi:hypothetical protein
MRTRGSHQPPQRAVSWRGQLIQCGDEVRLRDGQEAIFCFYEFGLAHLSVPGDPKWQEIEIPLPQIESVKGQNL